MSVFVPFLSFVIHFTGMGNIPSKCCIIRILGRR